MITTTKWYDRRCAKLGKTETEVQMSWGDVYSMYADTAFYKDQPATFYMDEADGSRYVSKIGTMTYEEAKKKFYSRIAQIEQEALEDLKEDA